MAKNWEEKWAYTQTKMNVYANCKADVFKLRDLMLQVMNLYLNDQSNDNFQLLHKVFMGNYNHMIFETIGEMRRMRRIVEIIDLEQKNHMLVFSNEIKNAEALMDKYMLTVFSLRRIELEPTEDMLQEGLEFLVGNKISPIAIAQILNDELFIETKKVLNDLADVYRACEMKEECEWMISIIKEIEKKEIKNE